jgi:hypothetical protein
VLTIGGCGNLNGDYWKSDAHGWAERVPLQAAWLNARRREDGLEWFGATELHAEKNAHLPLAEELGADWAIEVGPGGNLLIRVRDKVEVLSDDSEHFPRKPSRYVEHARYMTKWNVRNPYFPETRYWLSIEHFRSGSTKDIEAAKREQAECGNVFLRTPNQIHRGIRMGDYNSWQSSDDPTTPRGIMRAAGWRSLKHKTPKGSLVNGDLNTGLGWGHDGRWIEDMLTHDLIDVVYAQLWDARPLTDHSAWFLAKFNVHDKVLAGA